jgi:hypothetical protein
MVYVIYSFKLVMNGCCKIVTMTFNGALGMILIE